MELNEREMWRIVNLIESDLKGVDKEISNALMILDDNTRRPILVEHVVYSILCIKRKLESHVVTLNEFQDELFKMKLNKTKKSTGLEKLDLYFRVKTLKVDLKKKIKDIEKMKV